MELAKGANVADVARRLAVMDIDALREIASKKMVSRRAGDGLWHIWRRYRHTRNEVSAGFSRTVTIDAALPGASSTRSRPTPAGPGDQTGPDDLVRIDRHEVILPAHDRSSNRTTPN